MEGWTDGWTLASQPCPIASQLSLLDEAALPGGRWPPSGMDLQARMTICSVGFPRIHPSRPSPGGRRRPGVSGSSGGTSLTFCPVDARCPVCCLDPNGIFDSESHFDSIRSVSVLAGASFRWKSLAVLVLVPGAHSG